jgi:hypothetical protein
MARLTKAEKLALEVAERERLEREDAEAYSLRLMTTFNEAREENFRLEVRGTWFQVQDRDDARSEVFRLTYLYTPESARALIELAVEVELKRSDRLELERKAAARQAALAKLTLDERKLLNLA